MKPIFSRTLETTVKKSSIILVVLAGLACGWMMTNNFINENAVAFEGLLNKVIAFQHIMVFMGLNGVILAILAISTGTGLISQEVHEGTFKLLSAKPNSRSQILLSKIAGGYLGLAVLMVLQLLCYYGYVVLFSGFDGNIIKEMVSYLPGYLGYGLIYILIVLSISTFIGTIAKKKVAALLPLLAIVILIFGVIPFYRILSSEVGVGSAGLNKYVDVNYQLATIFKYCVSYKGKMADGSIVAYLTNLYKAVSLDTDIVRQQYGVSVLLENNDLSSTVSLASYMVFAAVMYVLSFVILKKKDI